MISLSNALMLGNGRGRGGGVPLNAVLIDDMSDLASWVLSGTAGGTRMADGPSAIAVTPNASAGSNAAITKTFSPKLDLSAGGFIVVTITCDDNAQASTLAVYLSSNNLGRYLNKFSFSTSSFVRGRQDVMFDLSTFANTGGESLANPMDTIRLRVDAPIGSVSIDKIIYIPTPNKDRPRVIIDFDDGWLTQYTLAAPYMASKGIPGTMYLVKNFQNGDFMTLAQMQELYSAGWDAGNHTEDHIAMNEHTVDGICATQSPGAAGNLVINGTLSSGGQVALEPPRHITFGKTTGDQRGKWITVTGELAGVVKSEMIVGNFSSIAIATKTAFDKVTQVAVSAAASNIQVGTARTTAEAQTALENNRAWLEANGMGRASRHVAYPRGSSSPASDIAMANAGMLTGRSVQYLEQFNGFGVANSKDMATRPQNELAAMKGYIDTAIASGQSVHFFFHKIGPTTSDSLTLAQADFEALMDYIAEKRDAGLIDPVTISQWYNAVQRRANQYPS